MIIPVIFGAWLHETYKHLIVTVHQSLIRQLRRRKQYILYSNTLRPNQYDWHFADDILTVFFFLEEKFYFVSNLWRWLLGIFCRVGAWDQFHICGGVFSVDPLLFDGYDDICSSSHYPHHQIGNMNHMMISGREKVSRVCVEGTLKISEYVLRLWSLSFGILMPLVDDTSQSLASRNSVAHADT